MPSVNVRFAEIDDIPALIELIAECAKYERSSHILSMTKEKGLCAIGDQLIPIPEQAQKFRPRHSPKTASKK